jgi:hypothetical protein
MRGPSALRSVAPCLGASVSEKGPHPIALSWATSPHAALAALTFGSKQLETSHLRRCARPADKSHTASISLTHRQMNVGQVCRNRIVLVNGSFVSDC